MDSGRGAVRSAFPKTVAAAALKLALVSRNQKHQRSLFRSVLAEFYLQTRCRSPTFTGQAGLSTSCLHRPLNPAFHRKRFGEGGGYDLVFWNWFVQVGFSSGAELNCRVFLVRLFVRESENSELDVLREGIGELAAPGRSRTW